MRELLENTAGRAIAYFESRCGGTIWQGQTAMRISVSSWSTTDDDVDQSLEAIIRIARKHQQ